MTSTNFDISSNNSNIELHEKAVKLEQDLVGRSSHQNEYSNFDSTPRQESISYINRLETEEKRTDILHTARNGATISNHTQSSLDDSSLCSTSSLCPAPLCRQFWRAGNYDDGLNSKPPSQNGTSYLHIHPKFLHSNATSHKWAFGAMAELLDNCVDEIQNGATFVIVDKTSNPRDGTPALLVQDNGGGMDPNAMRRCISFGFSDKKSKTVIGQYGNGFKTSTMRLGADVVVFSRQMKDRKLTQSVGLLSYTFLMKTRQDRIVVPMVDYQFNSETRTWNSIHHEEHLKTNLSILLQWSPFATEDELLKQCDNIGRQGTKIMIYNLWHNDEGKLELDFESDSEDICISRKNQDTSKAGSRNAINERHLANRLHHSLRAYLSILYLRIPEEFSILLRGRVVERHNIAHDLKFPEFILYKPKNVEGSVITTIGFLKEAPEVNIHGFNVYHKNRLILPFWHVVTYSDSRGRGVVGVLEANFIEPTHNKQEFEKTPVFQKLETRLKEMTQEYWDFHCGLLGYQIKKKAQPAMSNHASFGSQQGHSIFQPVILGKDSGAFGPKVSTGVRPIQHEINGASRPFHRRNAQGGPITVKRKSHDHLAGPEMVKRMNIGSRTTSIAHGGNIQVSNNSFQHAVKSGPLFENQEAVDIIQENKKLHAQCQEYEKSHEELNLKITRLNIEVREKRREYARLLIDLRMLGKVKTVE